MSVKTGTILIAYDLSKIAKRNVIVKKGDVLNYERF